MGIRYHFNTKYFIVNSKITDLCNRNRSAVLAYICLHTHTRSYRRESDDDRHTHTYTHPCLPLILCAHKHTHASRGTSFIALPGALHDRHTSSCVLEICLVITLTYTHLYPTHVWLRCTTYFSFTFTGAFPLHACGVTRNWRTYFISVRLVFLVQTVVLQTVLWDIQAWSARFLVLKFIYCVLSVWIACADIHQFPFHLLFSI